MLSTRLMHISLDLSGRLGPVRDQGLRPTCLAFATTSAHEALHVVGEPLSPEWLYYHAVKIAGDPPDAGSKLGPTATAVRVNGQAFEAHWSYQQDVPSAGWQPPRGLPHLLHATGHVSAIDFHDICMRLDGGHPSVLACRIDRTFDQWQVIGGEAVLSDAPPPYSDDSAHAVLAVGYGHISGTRFLKVRNSWGICWGIDGYAWVSEKYVVARTYGAMFLEEL